MPRPNRPGQTGASTGHRANIDIGGFVDGGLDPASADTTGADGVDVPANETEKGAAENSRPSKVTPKPNTISVGNKPNAFLNLLSGGKLGAAYNQQALEAAKFNAGAANDLITQQVQNAALLERGKTIQELVNKGQLDVKNLDGQNAIALAHANAAEQRQTAEAASNNQVLAKNGLLSDQKDAFLKAVGPLLVQNLASAATGQGAQQEVDNSIYKSPEFAATRKTGILSGNIAPQVANNAHAIVVPNGESAFVPNIEGSTTMYKGGTPGGTITEDVQTTTPTGIKHTTTAKPVIGNPASMSTVGQKIPLFKAPSAGGLNITAKPASVFDASFNSTNAAGGPAISAPASVTPKPSLPMSDKRGITWGNTNIAGQPTSSAPAGYNMDATMLKIVNNPDLAPYQKAALLKQHIQNTYGDMQSPSAAEALNTQQ